VALTPNKSAAVAAIVLGAGSGKRFGGPVRKQYLRLNGKPLLWWSLRAFDQASSVQSLTLVAPQDDLPALKKQLKTWRFKKMHALVAGGAERSDSVKEGLKAIPSDSRWVAVHDGVRPLITPDDIENVIRATLQHRAALAASPSRDTVKIVDAGGFVRSSPDRQTVWLAQTPQIFERALLERAHASQAGAVTDDAQLVERLGVSVKLVEIPPTNLKVTLPMDYVLAAQILKQRKRK